MLFPTADGHRSCGSSRGKVDLDDMACRACLYLRLCLQGKCHAPQIVILMIPT